MRRTHSVCFQSFFKTVHMCCMAQDLEPPDSSAVVMKTACTLDRCWRVGHQAAYAQFGVLRNRTSTVISLLPRPIFIHSGSGAVLVREHGGAEAPGWKLQEWRHRERTSATAEQVQEALQQLQAQGARIAALEIQLRIESARAQTAEQERSTLIQTLVTTLSKSSG